LDTLGRESEHRRNSRANAKRRWTHLWTQYGPFLLAALFALVFFGLMVQKHDAFNTRTYDLARFDQAIWNTLHGRFLFSSILNMSILGNHFSPFMALLSPLFLIWNDVKILFLVQVVSVAVTGLFLSRIVLLKYPALAPWFLLAFYLNPAVHETTLFEFRRVVPAMPFLAMALYALYTKKRVLMVLGMGLALLCKENVGLVVFTIGLYLLLFERDCKWGIPAMLVGGAWVVVVSLWVIPAFRPPSQETDIYPQLYYFDFLGDSYDEILSTLRHDPLLLIRHTLDLERAKALWRTFLPLGFVLPFLAPGWVLICLPTMAYLLISNEPRLYRLETWHLATVLPVLFAAIGVGLGRLNTRWARRATVALLATSLLGYLLFSPAPLGGTYEASLYDVTEHHRLAAKIIDAVPPDASVATQPRYVPHLSHREHVYHYPWIRIGEENVDYVLLDRESNPYPFSKAELGRKIDDVLTDPRRAIELEGDGIYLFGPTETSDTSLPVGRVVDGTMLLQASQVAVQDERGLFSTQDLVSLQARAGQRIRVALYWRALEAPGAERTVSVRLLDAAGGMVAQQDNWPGQGTKPTSWWEEGWEIRDLYYLDIPQGTPTGTASLRVLVYDSYSLEAIPFDDGTEMLHIAPVEVVH
jgi:uncharacterized membrane protein